MFLLMKREDNKHRIAKKDMAYVCFSKNLNIDKEYLFGIETLVFATSGILSMYNQLITLQRESKIWNYINLNCPLKCII